MYIPRFKLTPPAHTSGGEYADKLTGQDYSGYYVITSKGVVYSGQFFDKNQSRELRKIGGEANQSERAYIPEDYDIILNKSESQLKIKNTATLPLHRYTPNYDFPINKRFFAKSRIDNTITEISKEVYIELENKTSTYHFPTYQTLVLEWHVTAPLEDTSTGSYIIEGSNTKNRKAVLKAEQSFQGISEYLEL